MGIRGAFSGNQARRGGCGVIMAAGLQERGVGVVGVGVVGGEESSLGSSSLAPHIRAMQSQVGFLFAILHASYTLHLMPLL